MPLLKHFLKFSRLKRSPQCPWTEKEFISNMCRCRWWRRTTCTTPRAWALRASWKRRRNRKRSTSARPTTSALVFCGTTMSVLSGGAPSKRWRSWRRRSVGIVRSLHNRTKMLRPTIFHSANAFVLMTLNWSESHFCTSDTGKCSLNHIKPTTVSILSIYMLYDVA